MLSLIKNILSDDTGASAAEYAVLTALVIAVLVTAITFYTDGLTNLFTDLGSMMNTVGAKVLAA